MASIRKRTWVSKGQKRTAWVVDYFDQSRVKRRKTFASKKLATDWATTALHEVKAGLHTPASVSVTVIKAGDLWVDHCEAEGLERATVRQRQQHLRLHINPFLGNNRLAELTAPSIYNFDDQLRKGGRSVAMRRKVVTSLKTMLTFAQTRGMVAQNVARAVKVKSDSRMKNGPLREGIDFPSRAELRLLLDSASKRWRPLLVVAMFTGMRASELRGLRWSDVNWSEGIIHVRQRADAWAQIGATKTEAGKRDIPLAPIVVNSLREWHAACPTGKPGLVFPNGRGNVESLQNIYKRYWTPTQVASGLVSDGPSPRPRYRFHALRHAAASLFIAYLGWTPKRVQVVMGHSSITVTYDTYGHLFEDKTADREAMKKIEAAIVAA